MIPTSSQTAGPFFHIGLAHLATDRIVAPRAGDTAITVRGRIVDGDGAGVPDYLLEVWQRATGHETDLVAMGRVLPADDGTFWFTTVKGTGPAVPGRPVHAPHLSILVFMRGLLKPLLTRMYFPGEPMNDHDEVLMLVPPDRRTTLVARATTEAADELEWNIILQGGAETVFFEW